MWIYVKDSQVQEIFDFHLLFFIVLFPDKGIQQIFSFGIGVIEDIVATECFGDVALDGLYRWENTFLLYQLMK